MNIIYADFNAMTKDAQVCLTTRGSQEDMERWNVRVGDWVWLSDGELVVGARVVQDPYWGILGIPAWNTLVHLDDEGADDPNRILSELQPLLQNMTADRDQMRIFQLLTQLEHVAPTLASTPEDPGRAAKTRAAALLAMNHPELAMLEIEDLRRLRPFDSHEHALTSDPNPL